MPVFEGLTSHLVNHSVRLLGTFGFGSQEETGGVAVTGSGGAVALHDRSGAAWRSAGAKRVAKGSGV